MRYIHAVEGALYALVIFGVIFLLFPPIGRFEGAETVLTVSTFLFAILVGFFLTRLNSRYDAIRDLVVREDSNFKVLYQTAKLYEPTFTKQLTELIDEYYIISFDNDLNNQDGKATQATFEKIWSLLTDLKRYRGESGLQSLFGTVAEIERARAASAAISVQKLGSGEWAVLLVLATITLVSIFGLGSQTFALQVINVFLSSTLVLIVLIIRDLQNLLLGGKTLWAEESGQEVLELIGKPRYYNKYFIDLGINTVPAEIEQYRLGTHRPGTDEPKRIKLISTKRR